MMEGQSTKRTLAKALDAPNFSANRLRKIVRLFTLMIRGLLPKDDVRMTRGISKTKSWYLRIIRKVNYDPSTLL